MILRLYLIVFICLVCSGCKTFEIFLKKDESIPIITTVKSEVETETVWVPAKTKKVWVNPHIDDDGNMIDGHYKYVILEEGHWALQEIAPEAKYPQKQYVEEKDIKNE